MSVRLLTVRLVKHGRYVLRSYWKRDIHSNILEQSQLKTRSKRGFPLSSVNALRNSPAVAQQTANVLPRCSPTNPANNGLFRFGQHARKLFIDNILSRVTTNYSEELRQRATRKLFYGDSAPFFALIGVSLATGSGVLSKEDELEGVCWEIREAASRLQDAWNRDEISETLNSNFNIDQLDVGPPIAKGCAAVVYAANFKEKSEQEKETKSKGNVTADSPRLATTSHPINSSSNWNHEMMSPLQNMSRFVHNFGGSVDNIYSYSQPTAAAVFVEGQQQQQQQVESRLEQQRERESQQELPRQQATPLEQQQSLHYDKEFDASNSSIERYPLALKMMFNYDIQSNAMSILRAMYKETVPARQRKMNASADEWERLLQHQTLALPPHPNVVCMFGFFCDEVRNFTDGHLLYPIAQPQRINPQGYGRNMSLYLLMKRYDHSLRGLLDTSELSTRTKILLLAQMLEAVTHLSRHGVAHRDLKSDNVLIEMQSHDEAPLLVLSDFGCCLADKTHGLRLPYAANDIDKGGNAALMAPEIFNTQPGPFSVLNYSKADLWACGALAYEIFGLPNPFYSASGGMARAQGELTYSLRNCDYRHEQLPPLGDACPPLLQQLIYNILNPNPSKRVSPDIAANVLQLFLWAPSKWLKSGGMPNSPEILQWLLSLTTKIMCEGRPQIGLNVYRPSGGRAYVEYLLICSFLVRARLRRIRGALNWIQNTITA